MAKVGRGLPWLLPQHHCLRVDEPECIDHHLRIKETSHEKMGSSAADAVDPQPATLRLSVVLTMLLLVSNATHST